MHRFMRAMLFALAFCCSTASQSQEAIPPDLRAWQTWVLKGEEFRRCPFLVAAGQQASQPIDASAYRCVWPERLTLSVDARGGNFTQRWQVYSDSWVGLPGNLEHWPQDVRVNGAPGAVVVRGGTPSLRLVPGGYTVAGSFTWATRPESLPMPAFTALVDLSVDGQRVMQPERPGGALWLGKRRSAEQPAAMEVQVYRLVADSVPTYLQTRIRLNVAGDAREELLGRVLPDGFTPLSLTGDLPARFERDGRLRVQVRAGSHEVTLLARAPTVTTTLARPDPAGGKWPREEIWSFSANDSLRVAAAEGPEGIDPAQANVPGDWQKFPAFRMAADSKLTVIERSRGLSNADDNRLTLARDLWLDFDHGGFTAVDTLHGTMRRDWRLDMVTPFELKSASVKDEPLLVTESGEGRTGLELRTPELGLTTVARTPAGGAMPATGWNQRIDKVAGVLHLPPGHKLIAAPGTDDAPDSWLETWGLWSVFGLALVVVFVYWTAGRVPAVIAAVALLLTYQEMPPLIWLWGNLLAALAVARAAPEGKFRKVASFYRTASFIVLALALLPFMWMQVRFALYPQLEANSAWSYVGAAMARREHGGYNEVVMPTASPAMPEIPQIALPSEDYASAAPADAAAAPAADAAADAAEEVEVPMATEAPIEANIQEEVVRKDTPYGLNSQMVVQRYASGTRLQAGPGIPRWSYNSYVYSWSGPVETADTVRFIYLGPVAMFFWRILGVVGLALLFLWLARLSYGGKWRLPTLPGMPSATTSAAVLLCFVAFAHSQPAAAQATPNPALLEQLKQRLIAAPACSPYCAELAEARVAVDGERLEIVMRVSVLANLAVPMPNASDRWQLDDITVDSRPSVALGRNDDASLWLPLSPGAHTVRLAGRLAPAESIQVDFPQPPRVIAVSARGWTVSGVNEGRLVSGSLELARERAAQRGGSLESLESGSEFPAFVRVQRVFNLDLDWSMDTVVTRVAPRRAAVSVEIPLVKGESVLTAGVETHDDVALVGLGAGETSTTWHSGLVRSETLEVSLPESAARNEEWTFVVNPQWHVSFEGFPAVMPETVDGPNWAFRYIPRPGEKLVVHVTRPKGIEGTTLAIDRVDYQVTAGKRSSNHLLFFAYRSTQGGRHVVRLPADARVTSVKLDNESVQLRPEKGELPLSLSPGKHRVLVTWVESRDLGFRTRPPAIDLGSSASNITMNIVLPASRWTLFARGPGVGPAILYWGELAVFIVIAWLLGRWKHSPLRFFEWLLLGLGLSTQSWWVFAFTATWLLLMKRRELWQPGEAVSRVRFNISQVMLAAFTVLTLFLLVFSGIRNGLLSAPDMGVEGISPGYPGFAWFQDQTSGVLETPAVYSVPMWSYRLLFFVWAGWMAFALVGWLRWAFNAWKMNGLWLGSEKVT